MEGNDINILIINGHPRAGSFSDAIVQNYVAGASQGGASVEVLTLRELAFDHNVLAAVDDRTQPVEVDIERAREMLLWCEHLVVVFPTWWAGTPALLKGFLDRLLSSEFAFEETTGGTGYRGLLGPRAASIITTMDTPWWVYRWIYGRPVYLALKRCTLVFCGLSPVRVTTFASVKDSTAETRAGWLANVAELGHRTAFGPTRWETLAAQVKVWLQAMRLQFYPMTFLAYAAGAIGASRELGQPLHWLAFIFGYCFLFFIEVATVFANDVYDFESDRQNQFFGPFSGGSRVLVDGKLTRSQLGLGAVLALVAGGVLGILAIILASGSSVASTSVLFAIAVLAIGYTVAPMKLSHRGLGEIDVCLTHSFGPILCGYVLQGAAWNDSFPWLLGLPLCLSIMPSILLAGIPDRQADEVTGKQTLVVKIGARRSLALAAALTFLAIVTTWLWSFFDLAGGAYGGLTWIALPLGGWLLWRLKNTQISDASLRLDGAIAVALLLVLVVTVWIVVMMMV